MQCSIWQKLSLNLFQMLTCICSLGRVWEAEFLTFLKDTVKPTTKPYDPKEESKHIIYLEANNLYGYAMSKFLPASGFKWIDPKEFDMNKYTKNGSKGCVLEVNLEYPKEFREFMIIL